MTGALDEIEEIKKLKARYFRTLDTKDWGGFQDVFIEDVVFDMTDSGGRVYNGVDEFVPFVRRTVDQAVTVHQGHMPEIDLITPDKATGIWLLHDIVIWPSGKRLDGYGHYHEQYVKGPDGWRIASSALTRLLIHFSQQTKE